MEQAKDKAMEKSVKEILDSANGGTLAENIEKFNGAVESFKKKFPGKMSAIDRFAASALKAVTSFLSSDDADGNLDTFMERVSDELKGFVEMYSVMKHHELVGKDAFQFSDLVVEMQRSVISDKTRKIASMSEYYREHGNHIDNALTLVEQIRDKLKKAKTKLKGNDLEAYDALDEVEIDRLNEKLLQAYFQLNTGKAKLSCYRDLMEWLRCESGDSDEV